MTTLPKPPPEIAAIFLSYPPAIRERLMELRETILSVGRGLGEISSVQETLKWGEPSYSTIAGSTVRLGWKEKSPEHYCLFFHCQTKLVSTFRELYPDTFSFEGNRAITFHQQDSIPQDKIRSCIEIALTYHRRKKLPLLGASKVGQTQRQGRKEKKTGDIANAQSLGSPMS